MKDITLRLIHQYLVVNQAGPVKRFPRRYGQWRILMLVRNPARLRIQPKYSLTSDRWPAFVVESPLNVSHVLYAARRQSAAQNISMCRHVTWQHQADLSFRKHELRHLKPFTCDFADCKRGIQGFTTTNDLERHKKSVHRVNLGPGCYQCASETCRNPAKIWPRLDNFKQHLERMHPGEDAVDLINRYNICIPAYLFELTLKGRYIKPKNQLLSRRA